MWINPSIEQWKFLIFVALGPASLFLRLDRSAWVRNIILPIKRPPEDPVMAGPIRFIPLPVWAKWFRLQ